MGVSLAIVRTFRMHWWSRFTRHGGLLALFGFACVLGALSLCCFDYPSPDLPLSVIFLLPALACGFGMLVAYAVSKNGFMTARIPGSINACGIGLQPISDTQSVAHAVHLLLSVLTARPGWCRQAFTPWRVWVSLSCSTWGSSVRSSLCVCDEPLGLLPLKPNAKYA